MLYAVSFIPTGVQVIVITGDNKLTAEAICRKVGVFAVDEDLQGKSITGVEFTKLPVEKRKAMLEGTGGACFSRAEPKHKQVLCCAVCQPVHCRPMLAYRLYAICACHVFARQICSLQPVQAFLAKTMLCLPCSQTCEHYF